MMQAMMTAIVVTIMMMMIIIIAVIVGMPAVIADTDYLGVDAMRNVRTFVSNPCWFVIQVTCVRLRLCPLTSAPNITEAVLPRGIVAAVTSPNLHADSGPEDSLAPWQLLI